MTTSHGISCGGCGAPLSHINAVCDDCLPNFYSPPGDYRPYDETPTQPRPRLRATDLEKLVDLASKAVLGVLENDGGDFKLDKGPHGGWLIKHEGYFSLSVAMRAAVVAVITEMASHG